MSITLSNGEYFGKVSRKLNVKKLLLTETTYRLNSRLPSHEHENDILYFVARGCVTENYGRKTETYKTGDVIINPAYNSHSHKFNSSSVKVFNIELDKEWLYSLGIKGSLTREHFTSGSANLRANLIKIYNEFKISDNASAIAIEGITLETVAQILRLNTSTGEKSPVWINKVKEIISSDYRRDISLRYLSSFVNVHPAYLSRGFKKHTGITLSGYIRKIRIGKAVEKMMSTEEPLSSVAYECGFSDQSHFCNAFKNEIGISPSLYRLTKIN